MTATVYSPTRMHSWVSLTARRHEREEWTNRPLHRALFRNSIFTEPRTNFKASLSMQLNTYIK
jgi:hypothetical protein